MGLLLGGGGVKQGGWKIKYTHRMKTKPLTFLLALTFLFLFSGEMDGETSRVDSGFKKDKSDWKESHKLCQLLI